MVTPTLKQAIRELSAKDISILKALHTPPKCIKDVVLCVLYLNPTGNEQMYLNISYLDDWSVMRHMLGQPQILKQLQMYKYKEKMTIEIYYRIACILRSYHPMLNVQTIKKTCISAVGLFKYVMALMKYYSDNNDVLAPPSTPPLIKTVYQLECEIDREYAQREIDAFETRLLAKEAKEAKEAEQTD